jgi:succinate dehydrogenase (ubiquinone) membrane anchor subunit
LVLTALAPAALMLAPNSANMPIDYLLAIVIPFHSHVGLNMVVADYVPKAMRTMARSGVLACSVILFAGVMKLNVSGVGLTETVKALWREKKEKK